MSVLRLVVDDVLARFARRRRTIALPPGPVRLNVGGGVEVAPGWINVDASIHAVVAGGPRPVLSALYRRTRNVSQMMPEDEYIRRLSEHRFLFFDLTQKWPLADDSVDYIFCSHVMEHFRRREAQAVIAEFARVLKPGGVARICVPDLAKAFAAYQRGDFRESMRYFFTDEESRYDQHRYMYNFELMKELLEERGFVNATRREYREGLVPDLELLDNRPEETLYVEAEAR